MVDPRTHLGKTDWKNLNESVEKFNLRVNIFIKTDWFDKIRFDKYDNILSDLDSGL